MSDLQQRTRAALESLEPDTLRDALSLLMAGTTPESAVVRGKWDELDEIRDFPALISFLKRNFSIPELRKFSLEDGKVFVEVANRKMEISDPLATQSSAPTSPRVPPVIPTSPVANPPQNKSHPERFMNLEFDT